MPAGRRVAALILSALFLFAPGVLGGEEQKTVKEVRLEGLRQANEDFVRLKIRTKPGDVFSREIADQDIKNLMATGDFRNVTVAVDETPEGVVLAYVFEENPVVRSVAFVGNETIASKRLLRKMKPKEDEKKKKPGLLSRIPVPGAPSLVGSVYDPAEIERGVTEVKDYYEKKGYFAASIRHVPEIDKETNEVTVDVEVEEGPKAFITSIRVVGNQTVSTKEILKAVKTSTRKWFLPFIFGSGKLKRYVLDEDLDRIRALYQQKGFLDIAVQGARCAQCGYVYHPSQGDMEHNVLPGTPFEELPEEWICPSCKQPKGTFRRLGVDLTVLPDGKTAHISDPTESLLNKLGRDWKVPPKKREMQLTVQLYEGPQYFAGSFTIEGNAILTDEELLGVCTLKQGSPFDPFALERDRMAVYDKYGERGYIDALVSLERKPSDKPQVLDVVYTITENEQIRIGKIEVTGNLITKDKVIRREIGVNPGELFNMRKVRLSVQRLKNLNYFGDLANPAAEGVIAYDRPTDVEGVRDLVIEVRERPTGRLWFGGGVSSVYDVFGTIEVTQSNFDWKRWRSPFLRGAGQKARVKALLGTKRTDFIFSFTEPWLFDRQLSFGFDIFRTDQRYLSERRFYDQKNTGFDLKLYKSIAPATRAGVIYKLERVDLNVDEDASETIKKEEGESTVSSLEFETVRDTTDSYLMPTRGTRLSGSWQVAGSFLGSDEEFFKHEYRAAHYIRLYGRRHILRLLGRVGFAQEIGDADDVPIFERLFLGGPTTIRGFRYRTVGPKDELGEPIGGKSMLMLSAEYDYPIYGPLRGAIFYDTGNVWYDSYDVDPSDLRAGAGVGVRIIIPVMGQPIPINLDYGWPIDRDEWASKSGRFDFSMGFNF
ncbi:MAG: outer membrane protein assembly factor BamA [bacterium]|nr:outer membrane protein assembly factor BamA [bacterium]